MLTGEITNDRDYGRAQSEARKLMTLLAQQDRETRHLQPRLREAMHSATQARLDEIRERVQAYESLKRSGGAVIWLPSLEDLPRLLVQARVAANLTQGQLADRLGVSQQQVQKDEKCAYAGASFERLIRVANELGLSFHIEATLPVPQTAADDVEPRRHSGRAQTSSMR